MTKNEWDSAFDPADMLAAIRGTAKASQLWEYVRLCLYSIGADACVDLLEPHFAGRMGEENILAHRTALENMSRQRSGGGYSLGHKPVRITEAAQRARAGLAALQNSAWDAAEGVTQETRHQLQRLQCEWLRCIFSNPKLQSILDPSWLTSTVITLARQIHKTRDFAPMPILADALQDAGCDNDDILEHSRSSGPHVRACRVVDFVLGNV